VNIFLAVWWGLIGIFSFPAVVIYAHQLRHTVIESHKSMRTIKVVHPDKIHDTERVITKLWGLELFAAFITIPITAYVFFVASGAITQYRAGVTWPNSDNLTIGIAVAIIAVVGGVMCQIFGWMPIKICTKPDPDLNYSTERESNRRDRKLTAVSSKNSQVTVSPLAIASEPSPFSISENRSSPQSGSFAGSFAAAHVVVENQPEISPLPSPIVSVAFLGLSGSSEESV